MLPDSAIKHLCPVFLYFFKVLADPEPFVRARAQSLLQSLSYLQIEAVRICFEDWMSLSGVVEQTRVCKELLRINAQFPSLRGMSPTSFIFFL